MGRRAIGGHGGSCYDLGEAAGTEEHQQPSKPCTAHGLSWHRPLHPNPIRPHPNTLLLQLWKCDPATGLWAEEEALPGHTDWVRDVAWSPNLGLPRSTLASAGQDGQVRLGWG